MWTKLTIPRILRNADFFNNFIIQRMNKQSLRTGIQRTTGGVISPQQEPNSQQIVIPSIYSDVIIPDTNLPQFLFDAQESHGGRMAIVNGETGQSLTHAELRTQCHKVASALARLGISKGDTVALISCNNQEFIISYLAVIILGATMSTINNLFTYSEIEAQLSNSNCIAVICHANKLKDVLDAKNKNKNIRLIISINSNDDINDVIPLEKLYKDDGKGIPNNIQIDPEDVAALPYSSGTTGLPKGVMLTHRNIVANLKQVRHPDVLQIPDANDSFQQTFIGLLPLYHIYGAVECMLYSIVSGNKLITIKEFNPDTFIEIIRKYEPTCLHLVPPLLSFLKGSNRASPDLLAKVQNIFCGAAPLGASLIENFFDKFGHHMIFAEGYGMTECSPTSHISRKGHYIVGSCGVAIPNTLTKIIDIHTGKTLKPGEGEGELCVKGPQVMKGYFNNEKATLETIQDGWLHTGDICKMDENLNVFIVDRLKELIKVKGLQVPPAELENIMRLHKSVEDVAVIGVPDDKAGEVPKAFVVLAEGEVLDEQDLKRFVASRVAEYKKIVHVSFIKTIPKSAAGKILRKELKKMN